MRRILPLLLLLGVLLVAASACGGGDNASTPTRAATASATKTAVATPSEVTAKELADAMRAIDYPADLADGTSLGKPDAKVAIEMFEDFTCSHCLEFTALLEPGIIDELVKTGEAKLEFRYLPLRQSSVPIMVAAQCAADQNKFWEYGKRLFLEQALANTKPASQQGAALTQAFSLDSLKKYAADIGLDEQKFADCYQSQPPLDRIQKDLQQANQAGIRGTPGFVVNGEFLSSGYPATVADWKKLVESK